MANPDNETNRSLLTLFKQFDANDDGLIDESEFSAMVDSLGWSNPVEVISLEFAAIDGDDDGRVRFHEFADWWQDRN